MCFKVALLSFGAHLAALPRSDYTTISGISVVLLIEHTKEEKKEVDRILLFS